MATKERRAVGVLLAPLTLIERARGRRRLALMAIYALVAAALGLLAWRASRLSGLPDIGDPFDPAAILAVDVPEGRNAFTLWKEASAKIHRNNGVENRILKAPYAWPKPWDAEALDYLTRNAEALEFWRRGSERPDAMAVRPADLRVETDFGPVVQDHRNLARIALVTASGCIDRGDMEGAWGWYRAALRASRLIGRNGCLILSVIGAAEYGMTAGPVHAWAADPRVDAAMLKRALAEVIAIDAMTVRLSDNLRVEYLSGRHALDDRSRLFRDFVQDRTDRGFRGDARWVNHLTPLHHLAWFAGNEPERARRLYRLIYANWLADCDDLPADRLGTVPPAGGEVYDRPSSRSAGGVSGTELARRVGEAPLATMYTANGIGGTLAADRDRGRRAALEIALASAFYEREHSQPPKSPHALIGPYLERLPEGYVPPPPTTPEP